MARLTTTQTETLIRLRIINFFKKHTILKRLSEKAVFFRFKSNNILVVTSNNQPIINVLIVDDHEVFRQGFKSLITVLPAVNQILEAEHGEQALKVLGNNDVDIVFLDLQMSVMGGLELMKRLKQNNTFHQQKIIVFSADDSKSTVMECYHFGVAGFISKCISVKELTALLSNLHENEKYFNQKTLRIIVKEEAKKELGIAPSYQLTEQEIKILKLLCQAKSIKEMSEDLFVSENTVKKHRTHLYKKIGAVNAIAAIGFALKHGYISVKDLFPK